MYKAILSIFAILTILLALSVFQNYIYQGQIFIAMWAVDNLHNIAHANNDMWMACKRFNFCEVEDLNNIPKWEQIGHRVEHRFIA